MKKTISATVALFLALSLTACAPGWSKSSSKDAKSDTNTSQEAKVYGLGSTITDEDGVSIKLVSLTTSKGQPYVKPKLGKFLVVGVEIENGSKDEVSVSSIMSFSLASKTGLDFDVSPFFEVKNDINGTVKPGRKLIGQVAFDISVEDLYYFTFEPNVFADGLEFQFSSNDFAGK